MQFIDCKWVRENYKIFSNKRVVIITGAGISVNSGIPDFRSKNGIFDEIKQNLKVKGTDLFTHRYSIQPETRPTYLKFIYKLKELIDESKPTETHNFFVKYKNFNKKMHIYTQNIDGLEEKSGLVFSKESKKTEIIYLHGNMKFLKCSYCGYQIPFTKNENKKFKISEEIECINCLEREKKRKENNLRTTPTGIMNTTIIHYYQSHPESSFISEMVSKDTDLNLFIVMGTSLQIYGIKKIVKYFGFSNRNNKGVSIYVNKEEPRSEFKDVFDFQWKGDCDEFCKEILNLLETKQIQANESHSSILKIKETTKNEKNIRKSLDKLTISQISDSDKTKNQPNAQKEVRNIILSNSKIKTHKDLSKFKEISTPRKSVTIKIKKQSEIKEKETEKVENNKEISLNSNKFHKKQIEIKISDTNTNIKEHFKNETTVSNFVKNKNKYASKQTMKNKSEVIFTNEYSTITKVLSDSSEQKLFIFDKCESQKIEGMDCDDLQKAGQNDEKNEENKTTDGKKTQEKLDISIDDVKNVVRNIADLSSNAYIMESKPETVNKVDYVDSNTESSNCFMSKYSNTENQNSSKIDTNVVREYTVEETDSVDEGSEEKNSKEIVSPEIIFESNNSAVEEDQCFGEIIDENEFHEINEPEIKLCESQIESSVTITEVEKTGDENEQKVAIKTRPKRKSSKRFSTSYYRTNKKTGNKKKKSIPAPKKKINESEVNNELVDSNKLLTTENNEEYKKEGSFVVGKPTKEKGIKAFTKVVSKETNEK